MPTHPTVPTSDQVVANTQLQAPEVKELASGVDALYLSGHGYVPKAFLAQVEESRLFADRVSLPVPFELGPLTFGLAPHGWGKYRFCLDHESGRIGFTSSTKLPAVRIQPRAEFLHSLGPAGTVRHFDDLLRPLVDRLGLSVARIDLFCDVEGMELRGEDRRGFLCRGDDCTTYEAGHVCNGFAFGSRRIQRISARIYDKTAEMAVKGTDWWEEVWGDRHQPRAQVWRIEFEIGRAALTDLERYHPDAVLAAVPSMWRYCTGEWLTLRTPGADSNSSRWPVAAPWRVIQGATLAQGATDLAWIRRRKRASSFRRLMPGLVGYLVSFAALSGTFTVADTLEALSTHLADDEIARRTTFAERVHRRRAEGGIP
jgi:hypothetical protein